MSQEKISKFFIEKKGWIPALFLFLIIFAIIFLPTITTIILSALFFAYAVTPIVNFLVKRLKIPKNLSTAIVMILIFTIFFFLMFIVLPVIIEKISIMIKNIPQLITIAIDKINNISVKAGFNLNENTLLSKEMLIKKLSATYQPLMKSASSIFSLIFKQTFSILGIIFNFIIFIVIAFFSILNFSEIKNRIKNIIPPSKRDYILDWIFRFDRILSGFIHGIFTVAFILGSLYSLGFTIAGLANSGSMGAMVGMLCMIPYVGIMTAFIVVSLLAVIGAGFTGFLKVLIVFGIIQTLDTIFITPNIMGKKVGISPVFVIIALFSGAEIGGLLGVLLAVPLFAMSKLIFEDMLISYKNSSFYKKN